MNKLFYALRFVIGLKEMLKYSEKKTDTNSRLIQMLGLFQIIHFLDCYYCCFYVFLWMVCLLQAIVH